MFLKAVSAEKAFPHMKTENVQRTENKVAYTSMAIALSTRHCHRSAPNGKEKLPLQNFFLYRAGGGGVGGVDNNGREDVISSHRQTTVKLQSLKKTSTSQQEDEFEELRDLLQIKPR